MDNLFNPMLLIEKRKREPAIPEDLVDRIYSSQLIGQNSALVLHGGGNTSVKTEMKDLLGEKMEVLYVKGSGHDLATIDIEGFSALRLRELQELKSLDSLSESEMLNQLMINRIESRSPTPSIEGLLHAFLPYKFVDHSHSDSILMLSNLDNGTQLLKEVLGEKVVICPYFHPGFPLAKGVLKALNENPEADAVICLNHGIFTFGQDAETSYGRMIYYVNRAEAFIKTKCNLFTGDMGVSSEERVNEKDLLRLMQVIRGETSYRDQKGVLQRFYLEKRDSPNLIGASLSKHVLNICQSGVLTPDHALRTKNTYVHIDEIPMDDQALKVKIQTYVNDFRQQYDQYFDKYAENRQNTPIKLDNNPRVFLVAGAGIIALGLSRKWACIAADIAEQTIHTKQLGRYLGAYKSVSEARNFDLEYMEQQQQKLEKKDSGDLSGQIAMVTGAAGAIGFGIAEQLLKSGATVVLCDIDKTRLKTVQNILVTRYGKKRVECFIFDITNFSEVEESLEKVTLKMGGVDIIVPNAGVAFVAKIEDLSPEKFSRVMEVNLMGVFNIIKASIPVFRRQGTGGNVVLISSKNVFDPGAAFGAYSASKAAAHQISRIAALELAELGVRVNMVNPDAV
ncbi:MAG: SDR family NAD(P)-dependent oxidoreductase, partial [Proteobacteria bacterium]|nr:SDR family NAD(P)-dependent oxidoreductase [Pseudomonadota bacterium]